MRCSIYRLWGVGYWSIGGGYFPGVLFPEERDPLLRSGGVNIGDVNSGSYDIIDIGDTETCLIERIYDVLFCPCYVLVENEQQVVIKGKKSVDVTTRN